MRELTFQNLVRVCGASVVGEPFAGEISAVTTDSRTVTPGCLFAAIRGEKADGNAFVSAAFKKGAAVCLCEKAPENPAGTCLVVPETAAALRALAAFYREQFSIPFIGIAGSVGKTSAKEMIASVLAQHYCVLKTEKNFNNELGVPLTLFRLREEHEIAVIEMGISDFGEMSRLGAMVQPNAAVYTVIGSAHLEFLHDKAGVLKAKTEMLSYLKPDGIMFANGDDEILRSYAAPVRKVCYGRHSRCEVRGEEIGRVGDYGQEIRITAGETVFSAQIHAYGSHLVTAALGAAAVGLHFGLTPEEISRGIAAYEPVGSRAHVIETEKRRIIDDCYNANPDSMRSALRSLSQFPGRKVSILGDMRELGEKSRELHFTMGLLSAEIGSITLACGREAEALYMGAEAHGGEAYYFPDKEELLAAMPDLLEEGDTVLVKASHSMAFEEIVEALKK